MTLEKIALRPFLAATVTVGLAFAASCQFNLAAADTFDNQPSENKTVSDYDSIRLSGAFKGTIVVDGTESLTLYGEDLDERVEVSTKNNQLHLKSKRHNWRGKSVGVKISAKDLDKVIIDGAGNIDITGIKSDDFGLKLPGAATVSAEGSCKDVDIVISGAGTVDAAELHCNTGNIVVSGAATVSVYTDEKVDARVSGVGTIKIHGSPDEVDQRVSGVGRIKLINNNSAD